jgi:hypothetical protein
MTFFKECPSGGKVVRENMASHFEEGHHIGKKMLDHAQ